MVMVMEFNSSHCCFVMVNPLLWSFCCCCCCFYCWACRDGFNKESEQQHERNIERKKERRGPYDRSKGLFFDDVFFPFLILHTTNSKVFFFDGVIFFLLLSFTKNILRSRTSLRFNSSWSFKPKTNKISQKCLCGFFNLRRKPRSTP